MELLALWLWYLLPANPVLVRIVQGGSRRTRHLWIRMAYLGALVGLVVLGVLAGGEGLVGRQSLTDLAKSGQHVFTIVAYGQVILICLLSPLFMAGAIAAEQSGKTFNILLTTPLTNLQIVIGSLLGRLFFVLGLLVSGLPLFAILQIFGGVRMASVFISFGVAAMSAIMVGSVAITLAVLRIGGRKAVFIFVIAITAYLVGAYALDHQPQLRAALAVAPNSTTWLTPLHPILVLESSLQPDYLPPPPDAVASYPPLLRFYLGSPFEAFAALTATLSLLLVAWSAIRVRAVGQRAESGGGSSLATRLLRKIRGGEEGRHKPRDVWANPVAWREANTRGNRAVGILSRWAFATCVVGIAAVDLWLYHTHRISSDAFSYSILTLLELELAVVVLVAIYMSAGSISREREDKSLDLLLTTPISPHKYVWGKLRGLVSFLSLLLAAPVVTVLMLAVYTQVGRALQWPQVKIAHALAAGGTANFDLCLPEMPVLLALVLVPFVAACVALGMSYSVKKKSVLGAVVPSVLLLLVFVGATGFVGSKMAEGVWLVGAVLNAFSPTTSIQMFLNPWDCVASFREEVDSGRFTLIVASIVAAAGYSGLVYVVFWSLVRDFDQTVRRISGVVT